MKIFTIIRSHGVLESIRRGNISDKTITKIDNQDEEVNKILAKNPGAMVTVETIYNEKTGQLYDVIYIHVDERTDEDDNNEDDDGFPFIPMNPDNLKDILRPR